MEIWIPKAGRGYSRENVECRVQLEGPEKEWWEGTELDLLRAYQFPGHVTVPDGSVGAGSMGTGFV